MNFIELRVKIAASFSDILMAELAELGFESFINTPDGLDAYITEHAFREDLIKQLQEDYKQEFEFTYQTECILEQNWNEVWEKSYAPVLIAESCLIRASFHDSVPMYPYEIIINPKMSFGTGHHETTSLMIENQLHIDHRNKKVLDAGCGTGVLAIMAHKLEAVKIDAYDIDEWAVENAQENCLLNNAPEIRIGQGTILEISYLASDYDIILANINKNVLLEEINLYAARLVDNGYLIISGFYKTDMDDLEQVAHLAGLHKKVYLEKNQWISIVFQKNSKT